MTDPNLDACLEMYGAHIKGCITDYSKYHRRIEEVKKFLLKYDHRKVLEGRKNLQLRVTKAKKALLDYESARHYIFDGLLEQCIADFGLPLDAGYIQAMAKKACSDPSVVDLSEEKAPVHIASGVVHI
jgi:hypothetical protein